MKSSMEVFPDQRVVVSIEATNDELERIIESIEAVIELMAISEGFPHVKNLSVLIDALNCYDMN